MTCLALPASARCRTSRRVASPEITASPSEWASARAVAVGVDDQDRLLGDVVVDQGGDRAAPLGAVADDDHVIVHVLPPSRDSPDCPPLGGEHLQGGTDQHDQEGDAQRRHDERVDHPSRCLCRRDVAVSGGRQGDGGVVDAVGERHDAVVGVVVAVSVEVDQEDHRQRAGRGRWRTRTPSSCSGVRLPAGRRTRLMSSLPRRFPTMTTLGPGQRRSTPATRFSPQRGRTRTMLGVA